MIRKSIFDPIPINTRVVRDERIIAYPSSNILLHGKITKVATNVSCNKLLGNWTYPIIYGVTWDEIGYKEGYIEHGIIPEDEFLEKQKLCIHIYTFENNNIQYCVRCGKEI